MKTRIFTLGIFFVLIGCTSDNFENKKELHKKFKKLIQYEKLIYGYKSSYTSGVKYKFVTLNFDVGSDFLDSDREKKVLAEKLARLAYTYYQAQDDYDGLVINFEQKDGLTKIRETNHQFFFEDL